MSDLLIHLCPFDRNVGDNALNLAIEDMLRPFFDIRHMELVGNSFDKAVFEQLNSARIVLFGGGGVIHSCSGEASRTNRELTGTMWNMDLRLIERLASKIVLYGVGFNRFAGEPPPLEQMGQFFDLLSHKRAMVAFREDGSVSRFLSFFPRFRGIGTIPDPGLFMRDNTAVPTADYALIQIACDRLRFRYPAGITDFLDLVAALRDLSPVPLYLIPHTAADLRLYEEWRRKLPVDGVLGDFTNVYSTPLAMRLYRNALFTISTRGHSQICSVGNLTPTFTISTHPKAKGFMVDIGQSEATYDFGQGQPDTCLHRFRLFLEQRDTIVSSYKEYLHQATQRIADFNTQVVAYARNEFTPPLILTAPEAQADEMPANLDDEREIQLSLASSDKARKVRQTEDSPSPQGEDSYLPMRRSKVLPGTYFFEKTHVSPAKTKPYRAPLPASRLPRLPNQKLKTFARWISKKPQGHRGILLSCDSRYYPGLLTSIRAIRRYNPGVPITFMDAGLTDTQLATIKKWVDDVTSLPSRLFEDASLHQNHLSKAALSSLFCHLAGYEKVLYLDIDALVLGDLSPIFEALDSNTDIAGVQGNFFGFLENGNRHTLESEIPKATRSELAKRLPRLNFNTPAINSGCFAVWSHVSEAWEADLSNFLIYLPQLKYCDQSILNMLISAKELRLRLLPRRYNITGLSARQAPLAQQLTCTLSVTPDVCSFHVGHQNVVVAHYSGRSKPWEPGAYTPAKVLWEWHAAHDRNTRKAVVFAHNLADCLSEQSFRALLHSKHNPFRSAPTFEHCKTVAQLAEERGFLHLAEHYWLKAEELKPSSRLAAGRLARLAPLTGNALKLPARLDKAERLCSAPTPELRFLKAVTLPSIRHGAYCGLPDHDIKPHQAAAMAMRDAARNGTAIRVKSLRGACTDQIETVPEMRMLDLNAKLRNPLNAAASAFQYQRLNPTIARRALLECMRTTILRLQALDASLFVPQGLIAQLGPGHGFFLNSLATRTRSQPLTISTGLEDEAFSATCASSELDSVRRKTLGLLVLSHVLDRYKDPLLAVHDFAAFLSDGGYLMIIDAVTRSAYFDLREGLALLPPISRPLSLDALQGHSMFTLRYCWSVGGERILILSKCNDSNHADDVRYDAAKRLSAPIQQLRKAIDLSQQPVLLASEIETCAPRTLSPDNLVAVLSEGSPALRAASAARSIETSFSLIQDTTHSSAPSITASRTLFHVGYWSSKNAGDILLLSLCKELFQNNFPHLTVEKQNCDRFAGEYIRAEHKAILIGGGGLIHSTSPNGEVLHWNISPQCLDSLSSPLVFFAVGLNEFRGSAFLHSDTFKNGILKLVEKSVFVGLRERQACRILRSFLPPSLASKVHFQPCPSLFLPLFYPALLEPRRRIKPLPAHIFVNFALDRPSLRFPSGLEQGVAIFNDLVSRLLRENFRVTVVAHTPEDALAHTLLHDRGHVGLRILYGSSVPSILSEYRAADIVLGMRTHAVNTALGMGIPAIALATHDKLFWTMNDLDLSSWALDLLDTELVEKVLALTKSMLRNYNECNFSLQKIQTDMQQVTADNLQLLTGTLSTPD